MHCKVKSVCNEQALVEAFIAVVKECDPDIFVGYEVTQHFYFNTFFTSKKRWIRSISVEYCTAIDL